MDAEKSRSGRNRRYWGWVVYTLLLIVLLIGLHAYQTRGVARGFAPVFDTQLLDGQWISLRDYRGAPVLLHFWASWCPICRVEQASVESIAQDKQVLTISLDDMEANEIQDWMDKQGVSFPVVLDQGGEITRQYGVRGVPSSIIIDAQGRIRFVEVGYTTEIGLRLRLWWAEL